MTINLKKIIKQIILFEMIYMILINFICYFFNLPIIIRYLADILNLFIAVYDISNFSKIISCPNLRKMNILLMCALFTIILGYVVNDYPIWNFIWGFRTIIRFIIIFYGVILTFDYEDVNKVFNILNILFIVNVIVGLYQFIFLGWNQDIFGGTFSSGKFGGNAGLLGLLLFESAYVTEMHLNNKIKFLRYVIYILLCLILAALAEIKVFFILYFIILIISLVHNKFSHKTILTLVGGITLFCVGIIIFINIFPEYSNWFSLKKILSTINSPYVSTASNAKFYSLSRGSAISEINSMFFKHKKINQLLGFGLGSCISSSIPLFNSSFFGIYSYLNYNWFTHSFVFIETGIVGLVLFYLFYIICLLQCLKLTKKTKDIQNCFYINTIKIFAFLMIITTYYNSFLLTDSSYFAYIILGLSFIENDIKKII